MALISAPRRSPRSFLIAVAFAAIALKPVAHALPPMGGLVHLHPNVNPVDGRVRCDLYNDGPTHREVTVDGKSYPVKPHHWLTVVAPAGTMVFAGGNSSSQRVEPEIHPGWQPIR